MSTPINKTCTHHGSGSWNSVTRKSMQEFTTLYIEHIHFPVSASEANLVPSAENDKVFILNSNLRAL